MSRGKCDVAAMAVDTYLADVVRGARMLRVIAMTGRIPSAAYCASPQLPVAIVERIKQALVAFDPRKDLGRPYLGERHRITGFLLVGERHYDSLREVWQYIAPVRPSERLTRNPIR